MKSILTLFNRKKNLNHIITETKNNLDLQKNNRNHNQKPDEINSIDEKKVKVKEKLSIETMNLKKNNTLNNENKLNYNTLPKKDFKKQKENDKYKTLNHSDQRKFIITQLKKDLY